MIDYAGPATAETRWRRLRRRRLQSLLRVAMLLFGLSVIGGLAALFHFGVSPAMAYIGFFAGMLFLGGVATARVLSRRRRGRIVLANLGQAVSLALPIPPMLRAAAESEPRPVRRQRLRVAEGIEQGGGVASVLTNHVPEIPSRALSLVAVAEASGNLSRGIDAALDDESHDDAAGIQRDSLVMPMLLATLLVGMSVAFMILIVVVPKFTLMLRDLGEATPVPFERVHPGVSGRPFLRAPVPADRRTLAALVRQLQQLGVAVRHPGPRAGLVGAGRPAAALGSAVARADGS